ncbi:unnamed protein product [Trichobilharzia regenti]|nr:unnamed protein product [Trichobilharzia regenti]
MRIENADELMIGYKSDDVDPAAFYWYTDQVIFIYLFMYMCTCVSACIPLKECIVICIRQEYDFCGD